MKVEKCKRRWPKCKREGFCKKTNEKWLKGRCDCSSFILLQLTPSFPHRIPHCRPPPLAPMLEPNLTRQINGPRKQAASAQWRLRIQGRKRNWCNAKIKGKENGRRGKKREEPMSGLTWACQGNMRKTQPLHLCVA